MEARNMSFAERYGPWAVVAGASEGTGRAFARKIAAHGVPCILIARRAAPLAALADEIRREYGISCITAAIDLSAADACDRIVAAVGTREVGLFISNAGADPNGAHFLDRDLATWLELVRRNVLTTMQCCHHFGGLMKARHKGGLLLVNSGACYGGGSFMSVYSASKAFTLCLGEALWVELRPYGIDVLNLVLGRTDTPALRTLLAEKGMPVPTDLASPDAVAEMGLAKLPHGPIHNWGYADDIAGFAPNSPDQRRARILAMDQISKSIFGTRQL
jgi:short-subunit dehydrogenase